MGGRKIITKKANNNRKIDSPKKIALVSRNYKLTDDFSEHMSQLIGIVDQNNCDTVIYSMWSFDDSNNNLTEKQVFVNSKNIKRVILETGNLKSMTDLKTEIWSVDNEAPQIIYQEFAKANEDVLKKKHIVSNYFNRIIENCFLLLCGEMNIIKYKMQDKICNDEFDLTTVLNKNDIKFIINPIHDYMVRHEMKKKRAFLSFNNRYVISVWNTGKISSTGKKIAEAKVPWTVFNNGHDISDNIIEIKSVVSNCPDIRIGVLTI